MISYLDRNEIDALLQAPDRATWLGRRYDLNRPVDPDNQLIVLCGTREGLFLAALSARNAMAAGEVAAATGLARATVSTTLTKLAKTGEVDEAQRGYHLPTPASSTDPAAADG